VQKVLFTAFSNTISYKNTSKYIVGISRNTILLINKFAYNQLKAILKFYKLNFRTPLVFALAIKLA
jgi:hypothetical protein